MNWYRVAGAFLCLLSAAVVVSIIIAPFKI